MDIVDLEQWRAAAGLHDHAYALLGLQFACEHQFKT